MQNKLTQNTGKEKEVVLAKTLEFKGINGPLEAKIIKTEKSIFRGGNSVYIFQTDKDICVFQINNIVMFLARGNVTEDYKAKKEKSSEMLDVIKNIRKLTIEATNDNIEREMDIEYINEIIPTNSTTIISRVGNYLNRILFGKLLNDSQNTDKKRRQIIELMVEELDKALAYYTLVKNETKEFELFLKNLVGIRLELNSIFLSLKNSIKLQKEISKNFGLVTK